MRALAKMTIAVWGLMVLSATAGEHDSVEVAVAATLNTLHRAASAADGELYFSLFAEGAVFLGTDTTERWSVEQFRDYAEPFFSKGQGWTYVAKERHVYTAPDQTTAWFDEILWNEHFGTCRGTGVLVQTAQGWQIAQYHLTIPIPNDLAAEVAHRIKEYEADTAETP